MNRLALVLAVAAPACTQDADIGLSSQPVACQPEAAGEVEGALTNDAGAHELRFVSASLRMQPTTARLEDPNGQLTLDLAFVCGPPGLDTYGVVSASSQQVRCPREATGRVTGGEVTGNLLADAESGRLVVDRNVECLAGRFDVDFGTPGRLSGWFSLPLP